MKNVLHKQFLSKFAGLLSKETEEIIIKLVTENIWGYGKIQGEMKKLGYHVSPSYVCDVLKKNGIPPSGQRRIVVETVCIFTYGCYVGN